MSHYSAGQTLTAGNVNTIAHQGIKLLDEIVLDTAQSSVSFTDIDQSYRNLQVLLTGGYESSSTQLFMTLNGDTGTNYKSCVYVMRASDVFEAFPADGASQVEVAFLNGSSLLNSASFVLSGYSRTDRDKLFYGQSVSGITGSTDADLIFNHVQAWWKSTSAVTDIQFVPNGSAMLSPGSIFQLYGLGGSL